MKRILAFSAALIFGGWALWVSWSLIGIGEALPDFPSLPLLPEQTNSAPAMTETAASSSLPVDSHVSLRDLPEPTRVEPEAVEPAKIYDTSNLSALDPPLSIEERCVLMRDVGHVVFYGGDKTGRRAVEFYAAMTATELQARADLQDDGFAEYFFAERRLDNLINGELDGEFRPEAIPQEAVETIREYFLRATRKQIKGNGLYHLAWLCLVFGDKIEAAGWLALDQRMGGDGFESMERNLAVSGSPFWLLDEYHKSEGEARAEELIAEHELADSLNQPAECRSQ